MLKVCVGTLLAARLLAEVGHTVAHKDVPALLVLGIDLASGNPEDICMAAAGYIGKLAPVGHNLAGVDVPQEAGLGMADIPSRAVVDTAAADTVHCFVQEVCSCQEAGMAYSAQEVHTVAEVPDTADSYSKQEHPVPGHVVEVGYSRVAHEVYEVDVCLVPASLEKLCS